MKSSNITPEQFKKWRIRHGMSQASCAARLGISQSSIFVYEEGKRSDGRKVEIPKLVSWGMSAIDNKLEPYKEE